MDTLQNELLELDSESYWTGHDLMDPAAGQNILKGFFQGVLDKLVSHCPTCHSAYIAIAGIVPEEFVPVAVHGRDLKSFAKIHIERNDAAILEFLSIPELVSLQRNVHKHRQYTGPLHYCEKIIVQLRGYGELFGFISFDADRKGAFTEALVQEIDRYQPLISRICADAVFSMRLRELAVPFESAAHSENLDALYQEIADRTLRVFAADGVMLRIYNRETDRLEVEAYTPMDNASDDKESQRVTGVLLSENSVGEEICRLVHKDANHTWAVGMLENDAEPEFSGTPIFPEMEGELRHLGIRAYCVFQLISEVDSDKGNVGLGTLAFFHRHQHRYSWRDISLANSLCQRAADTIALYNRTRELRKTNERMFLDGQMMTRVEIVTLLTHDLGHKAFSIHDQLEEFIANCKKAFREGRGFSSIKNSADETLEAANAIIKSLYSINTLFKVRGEQAPKDTEFELRGVVEEIQKTMKDALVRNRCELANHVPNKLSLYGNRAILLQAMFNLVINAIDAQRSRKNPRKNTITISAEHALHGEGNSVVIDIRDEGPGINRTFFNDANEIFKLGATSKTNGTGRGLTISRSLLGEFYGAHLRLEDPEKAMFKIIFPLNRKGKQQ